MKTAEKAVSEPAQRIDPPFRSRRPVSLQRLPGDVEESCRVDLNERERQLLRQRRRRDVFLDHQAQTDLGGRLADTQTGRERGGLIYRLVLQSKTAALDARLSQSLCVRGNGDASLSACPLIWQQATRSTRQ